MRYGSISVEVKRKRKRKQEKMSSQEDSRRRRREQRDARNRGGGGVQTSQPDQENAMSMQNAEQRRVLRSKYRQLKQSIAGGFLC